MDSVLNLNTTWCGGNFLNYVKHSLSGTIVDLYDSLYEQGKIALRIMQTPVAMFKTEFIRAKLENKKKLENDKERLIT